MALPIRTAAHLRLLLLAFLGATSSAQIVPSIEKTTQPVAHGQPIAVRAVGRTKLSVDGTYTYQWPGVYFIATYRGTTLYFQSGPGKQHLRITLDGKSSEATLDAGPGTYRIPTPGHGTHTVRLDVINENQDSPKSLGAFAITTDNKHRTERLVPTAAKDQLEFIGDSHTVGYGNTSSSRTCTEAEVWNTTDTSRASAALVAARFHADYQVNAISGRGVVRNYNGLPLPTLPEAYPYTLLPSEGKQAQQQRYADPNWSPSVIVISLGTNDFSTDLHAGEPWHTRADLHAAFETTYVAFVRGLRAAHPRALMLLWATDMAHGEIATEGRKVTDTLRNSGDTNLEFIEIPKLTFAACNGHPTTADDETVAKRLITAIDAHI